MDSSKLLFRNEEKKIMGSSNDNSPGLNYANGKNS